MQTELITDKQTNYDVFRLRNHAFPPQLSQPQVPRDPAITKNVWLADFGVTWSSSRLKTVAGRFIV